MKILANSILMLYILFAVIACASMGETMMSTGFISVKIGPAVMADSKKQNHLREHQGVETLHRYIAHRFKKLKVRRTLSFDVTITAYRVGWGRDHMSIAVIVKEQGKELARFNETETTSRSPVINKLSKGLAKRMYEKIKDV